VVSDFVGTTGSTACSTFVQVVSPEFRTEVQEKFGIRPFPQMPCGLASQKLDGLLRQLDPRLAQVREAAWQAFQQRATTDYVRQAASSMRELLDHLFSTFAPDNEVMGCSWWKPHSSSRQKPSKRDKLRFLIYGVSAPENAAILNLLDEKIE